MIRLTGVGDGGTPTFVLIHGLGGSRRTFTDLAPLLTGRRVLMVDLPQRGSVADQGRALAARLRDVQLGPVVLVGHSRGGLVALAAAEADPANVQRLVIVGTASSANTRLAARSATEQVLRRPVLGGIAWAAAQFGALRRGLQTAVAPGMRVPDHMVEDLARLRLVAFVDQTDSIDDYLAAGTAPERLAGLTDSVDVDVVFGMLDQRVAADRALTEYSAVPGVLTHRIESVGHTPPIEAPAELAAVLVERGTA